MKRNETNLDGIKLCDFGISRIVEETGSKVREILGTPDYVAPEVCVFNMLGEIGFNDKYSTIHHEITIYMEQNEIFATIPFLSLWLFMGIITKQHSI